MFNLETYVDIKALIDDPQMQRDKYLKVKKCYIRTPQLQALEDAIRSIPSDAENWKDKVDTLKRQISAEKRIRFVIKYDKNYLNADNIRSLGLFRSVITDGKKILSFAPPKSLTVNEFCTLTNEKDRHVLEYCEGTMINMYFDSELNDWEIATRSNIGARCKFYQDSQTTFRRMFLDAFTKHKLEFSHFDPSFCYSFVLQHPDNRIVVPYTEPKLILTNIYKCDGMSVKAVVPTGVGNIQTPSKIDLFEENGDIPKIVDRISSGKDLEYTLQGVVICDYTTGLRMKVRNPCYEYVRQLKGNNPKSQFQYYHLRKNGKVKEYLRYYPEEATRFGTFRTQLHLWTHQLWHNYINCYINKEKPLREYPFEFRSHMYTLHRQYLDILRENKQVITKKVVVNYVNNLPSEHLMASINYPLKKVTSRAKTERLSATV